MNLFKINQIKKQLMILLKVTKIKAIKYLLSSLKFKAYFHIVLVYYMDRKGNISYP